MSDKMRLAAIRLLNNLPPLTGEAAEAAHDLNALCEYCPSCGRHRDTGCFKGTNGKVYMCGEDEEWGITWGECPELKERV